MTKQTACSFARCDYACWLLLAACNTKRSSSQPQQKPNTNANLVDLAVPIWVLLHAQNISSDQKRHTRQKESESQKIKTKRSDWSQATGDCNVVDMLSGTLQIVCTLLAPLRFGLSWKTLPDFGEKRNHMRIMSEMPLKATWGCNWRFRNKYSYILVNIYF